MFDSKSPVVKVVGYVIIGFFVLIIAISFGMPDFMSRMGMDNSTAVIINGEKIHVLDYLRFRDTRFGHIRNKKMEPLILNQFIGHRLIIQEARKAGFSAGEERIIETIHGIGAFQTGGAYDAGKFKRFIQASNYSLQQFYKTIEQDIISSDFRGAMQMGMAFSSNEIEKIYRAENISLQIRYCRLPMAELRKRFSNRLTVSDEEVEKRIASGQVEIKDPKTDRQRIKSQIRNEKLSRLIKEYTGKINRLNQENASFQKVAARMQGKTGVSAPFSPGEEVRETGKKATPISGLSDNPTFASTVMDLEPGRASPVIQVPGELIVFTVVEREMATGNPSPEEEEELREKLASSAFQNVYGKYMTSLFEKSKIKKMLKTD
jgi:hypothetical protein